MKLLPEKKFKVEKRKHCSSFYAFVLAVLVVGGCTPVKKGATPAGLPVFDMEGHRGARGLMPENTIPAMKKGIDMGVTTLEMDIVISKDNQVVVSHDLFFNEAITTAPDGKYLTKKKRKPFCSTE